jgi:hypothetical protein
VSLSHRNPLSATRHPTDRRRMRPIRSTVDRKRRDMTETERADLAARLSERARRT